MRFAAACVALMICGCQAQSVTLPGKTAREAVLTGVRSAAQLSGWTGQQEDCMVREMGNRLNDSEMQAIDAAGPSHPSFRNAVVQSMNACGMRP